MVVKGEPNYHWDVTYSFSTKPLGHGGDFKGCSGQQIEDPLSIPQRISGGTTKYQVERRYDRHANPFVNTAQEQIHGPPVEFDRNRGTITIEQNVLALEQSLCNSMMNKVNASPLWGQDPRCVKMSDFRFERKYYGTCYIYFTRIFTFDILNPLLEQELGQGGFDRTVPSYGTKALRGRWYNQPRDEGQPGWGAYVPASDLGGFDPAQGGVYVNKNIDLTDTRNFIQFKDWYGHFSSTLLDKNGLPVTAGGTATPKPPAPVRLEAYQEVDFLQLGIPSVIDQFSG
jgi:hypothetical protein